MDACSCGWHDQTDAINGCFGKNSLTARLTARSRTNIVRYNSRITQSPEAGQAMTGKTVTRSDLCEAVYQKVGLSRTESATLVELVLKEITDCLERGETVKLSSFGSFVVRKKGQRVGRNPKTGKEVPISPRRVMVFKPSAILKQRINGHAVANGDGKDD